MKLTNKILLGFIILLFLSFAAFRLIIHSKIELVPRDYKYGPVNKTLAVEKFSTLEINGGYYVHLIKSDYDSMKITGPDNLIENYTTITNKNGVFNIESKIDLTKYFSEITVWILTKELESVHAGKSAIITMESFRGEQISFAAEDSSIINCENCSFTYSKFTLKDKAVISLDKTQNAIVDVNDSSTLFLNVENGDVSGNVSDKVELFLTGTVKKNTVTKTENKHGGSK
ncbi:MAG: DUF2807 domain-containing protein [Ignavibacteriales bacterium]|nr:DUF2807 domain-containing protein [Ignavibacteriales bacterium]